MTSEPIEDLLNNSKKLHSFITNRESDLTAIANSKLGLAKLIQLSIIRNDIQYEVLNEKFEASITKVGELEQEIVSMNDKLESAMSRIDQLEEASLKQSDHINNLHERLAFAEQYSRRNTAIVTKVPYLKGENLEVKICKLINDTKILPFVFTRRDISHVHRNKFNQYASITLVFARGIDKDRIFSKKSVFKSTHTETGINIHHAMSKTVQVEKEYLEAVEGVKYVEYRGIRANFVVKMLPEYDDAFFKKIRGEADLRTALTNLPSYKPQVVKRKPTQLMLNQPSTDILGLNNVNGYVSDIDQSPLQLGSPPAKSSVLESVSESDNVLSDHEHEPLLLSDGKNLEEKVLSSVTGSVHEDA